MLKLAPPFPFGVAPAAALPPPNLSMAPAAALQSHLDIRPQAAGLASFAHSWVHCIETFTFPLKCEDFIVDLHSGVW